MYGNKVDSSIAVVDLQSVIEGLSNYKETLESKYPDIDFKEIGSYGAPIEIECVVAEAIGIKLDECAKANSQLHELTSSTFYETGQDVIKNLVKDNKITEEVGSGLVEYVPDIARHVIDDDFGCAVWCYKKTQPKIQA